MNARVTSLLALLVLAVWCGRAPAEAPRRSCDASCVRGHLDAGRFRRAAEAAREMARREEEHRGPDSPLVADALDILLECLLQAGQGGTEEALVTCRRSAAIRESTTGPDDLARASSLHGCGAVQLVRGAYAEAAPLLERALRIRTERLGEDHPDVASSLHLVGALRSESGDHAGAAELLERSVRIRELARGVDHPAVAEALNALASVRVRTGDYAAAESLYTRALEIWATRWGRDHLKVATCLNNISTLLYATGDYEGALTAKQRALAIRKRSLGPDHELVAWTLANMGMNLAAMGRVQSAREHYRRALEIQSRRFGKESDEVGWTMKRFGDTYLQRGTYETARGLLARAVEYLERGLGTDHPDVAEALASLAAASTATGDTANGSRLQARALRLLENRLGPDHPEVGFTCVQYARALAEIGANASALEWSLRGEEVAREHLRLTCRSFPERSALAYAAARPAGGRLALRVLAATPDPPPESVRRVWDSLVRSRTLVLDEIAARQRAAFQTADPEVGRRAEALSDARRRLADLRVAGPGSRPRERYLAALGSARDEVDRAEKALAAVSAAFSRERSRALIGYTETAAALPSGTALVAYAVAPSDSGAYVAFILRAGEEEPAFVPLGAGQAIEAAASRWLQDVSRGSGPRAQGRGSGEILRKLVWDPVSSRVGAASRVFLVPDGALHRITFAALPWREREYLIESGPEFHYLTAERDLAEISRDRLVGSGMLAMGDPRFDLRKDPNGTRPASSARDASGCLDFASIQFPPLPSSGPEVREVAQVWARREQTDVLVGPEATEAAFKASAPGHRVLHLATHGFFVDGACRAARTGSRAIETTVPARIRPGRSAFHNPIHLSGLVWAGANQREVSSRGGEDGILTAEEIASVDLTGVEWAVLSACDTGTGRIQTGEGVLGLRRAFQVAGARTVIMSLWDVDDESARQWMRALYEARVQGELDTASSVTKASLSVLRERRARSRGTDPLHWASFVAAGDWR